MDFLAQAEIVELDEIPDVSRDTKDNIFLATALAAQADYLITEDADLLVLEKFQKTTIVTCPTFAEILEG